MAVADGFHPMNLPIAVKWSFSTSIHIFKLWVSNSEDKLWIVYSREFWRPGTVNAMRRSVNVYSVPWLNEKTLFLITCLSYSKFSLNQRVLHAMFSNTLLIVDEFSLDDRNLNRLCQNHMHCLKLQPIQVSSKSNSHVCRYFISDEKLAALGWREKTSWEDGLKKTIDWYLNTDMESYWKAADIQTALQPHPTDASTSRQF